MTGSELLFVIGDIDADLVERAERSRPRNRFVKTAWATAVAACILVAVMVGVVNRPATQSNPNETVATVAPTAQSNQNGEVATVVPIVFEPMICVNSTLYVMEEERVIDPNIAPDQELLFLGRIASYVDSTFQPSEELQSNNNIVGAEVYQQESNILIFYNGHCWVYRPYWDTNE